MFTSRYQTLKGTLTNSAPKGDNEWQHGQLYGEQVEEPRTFSLMNRNSDSTLPVTSDI